MKFERGTKGYITPFLQKKGSLELQWVNCGCAQGSDKCAKIFKVQRFTNQISFWSDLRGRTRSIYDDQDTDVTFYENSLLMTTCLRLSIRDSERKDVFR